jgi:hypothetical protein
MIATSPLRAIDHAVAPRALTQKPEHDTHVDSDHRSTQIVIPCEQVPQAIREAQHPLPNRHVGQHVVDQVRRTFGHAAAAATRAKAASLARERQEAIVAARIAVKTGESCGQTPTREELAELALNESRETFTVPQRGRLRAKRLEVITNEMIEDALRRIARLVGASRLGHIQRAGGRHASRWFEKSGAN